MSSHRPPVPVDAAHGRHDELLIAQLAGGDALDPQQDAIARQLIASCPDCRQLASDLRAIAGAVGREPVPPRRRDLRVDAARAAQLRGSPWSRLLRRFSVPRSGALRPAAAGVMSLGLLFVVAGSVWPETATSPATAPAAPGASALIGPASATFAPQTVDDATGPAATSRDAVDLDLSAAAGEARAQEAFEGSQKASDGPPPDVDTAGQDGSDAGDGVVEEEALADALLERDRLVPGASPGAANALAMEAPMTEVPARDTSAGEPVEPAPADEQGALAPASMAPAAATAGVRQGLAGGAIDEREEVAGADALGATVATTTQDGVDIETILVWVGAILAVGGALVLVLSWLSRRSADPLLR